MDKKKLLYIFLAAIILYVGYLFLPKKEAGTIHIAFAGPISGPGAHTGKLMANAIKLHFAEINQKGGINGYKLELDVYDDGNQPEKAENKAKEILKDNKAIAVIGHMYSNCSIKAGKIYKESKIPAISPASTNTLVTQNNPWYFRTIFHDDLQGKFLANYAWNVFNQKSATIISEDQPYGSNLAKVFEKTSRKLGFRIKYKRSFKLNKEDTQDQLVRIVSSLKLRRDLGIIFLATHGKEGVELVKLIRKENITNPIITPDSFASEVFPPSFDEFSKSFISTANIYTTAPIIYDTASEKALRFQENFEKKYSEKPDWISAFAYDAAKVVTTAIQKTRAYQVSSLTEQRQQIRDYLASINQIELGIEGATGYNYFDKNGDAPKSVSVGVYKNNSVISALIQLLAIQNIGEITDLNNAIKQGLVLNIDDRYMYKTNVVYTGIKINKISDLDLSKSQYTMDFYLWFRYQKGVSPEKITFPNAVEEIDLGTPLEVEEKGQLLYKLYHVSGKFKIDSLPGRNSFGQHVLGISFRHRNLNRNNLIYVSDFLGMGLVSGKSALEKLKQDQVFTSVSGWNMDRVWYFQDIAEEDSLGFPKYINISNGIVEYSKFNAGIRIKKDQFSLKSLIPNVASPYFAFLSFALILSIPIISKRNAVLKQLVFLPWVTQICVSFLFLLSLEVFLIDWFVEDTSSYNLRMMITTFDILWWLMPAAFLNWAIQKFMWEPVQKNTGRRIPTVVRRMLSFLIYTLAIFGVIAYVFDQRLTSLLATSGMIAMIIGLAIQINISNIFSGIAINLERPFNVGDWIRLGEYDEGKVVDITWRSTRIKTRDENILSIPNAIASESIVKNFNYPNDTYEMKFFVHVDPIHTPERVQKILMDAVLSSNVISKETKPYTRFKGFTEWSAKYGVYFILQDYSKRYPHEEVVWKRVWAHLNRSGITPAIQRQELHMFKGIKARGAEMAAKPIILLQEIDIFHPFLAESKEYLSNHMEKHLYRAGTRIVQQGEAGNSLFIIVEGVVKVLVTISEENTIEVARLGAGSFFGEMSLLTGETRTASIDAGTDTVLYEITKEDIAPLIEKQPEVMQPLSEVLMRRKMATESEKDQHLASQKDKENQFKESLQQKIQRFFGFGKTE
ncbi:MAG: ABC transporter substrate-binding protein [Spirochaetota bacterium]